MNKRYGALSSSVNPMELATTAVGFIRLTAGALASVGILTASDIDVVNIATEGLLAQIAVIVPAAVAVYGFCEMLFGLVRKVVVWFTDRGRRVPGVGALVGGDILRREYSETDPSLRR